MNRTLSWFYFAHFNNMISIKEHTVNSVKWTSIEKFSLQLMQFVLGIFLARLLSPSDFGTVGMIAIFIAVSNTFIDSGFGNALIRKQNCSEQDYSTVFYFNIVVAIACYTILFFTAPIVASFFKTPILKSILRIQSISLVLNSLMQIQVAQLTRNLDFKGLAKRSMLSSFVSGIFSIIFAYMGFGVWALVAHVLIASFFNLVFIWVYCDWRPRLLFSWTSFKDLGSYGSKLLASSLLHTLYTNMTTLVIGKFCSAKELGYYNRGVQFASLPVHTANDIFTKVTFPILTKIQSDDARLVSVYRKYICVLSIPIFFCCMLLVSVSKPLILLLLTDKWLPAVVFLQIYTFAIMFNHITTINLNLLKVKGRSDLFLRLEIIKKSISFIILIASIPFGAKGICVSQILYTQIAISINTYYTGKLFSLGYWIQVKDFSKYLFGSIIACAPSYILNTYFDVNLLAGIFVGIIVSLFLYCLIFHKNILFQEILTIVRREIEGLIKTK